MYWELFGPKGGLYKAIVALVPSATLALPRCLHGRVCKDMAIHPG